MWTVTFSLSKPSRFEVQHEIDGIKVEVREDGEGVVASSIQSGDIDEARRKALSAANQFLDILSWKCDDHLAIKGEPIIERIDPSGDKPIFLYLRDCVVVREKSLVIKKDASGDVVEVLDSQRPGEISVKHSDAAAFYRQAHLAEHPFEKFANLYKVVENIADKIRDIKEYNRHSLKRTYGGDSYEMNMLQLALDECFGGDSPSLVGAAKGLLDPDDEQPIPRIVEILYKANRCQIMHAKDSGGKKIPFNLKDEEDVTAALRLMDFVAKSLLEYEQTLL